MTEEIQLPLITVVIPVRNEERFIASTLAELLGQDYPPYRFEIIVADGESTDSTRKIVEDIAKEHPQVVLKSNPRRLPSSGRNVGFMNGRGEVFLVIDGHCRIDNPELFRNIAGCFAKSDAHCLCRPQPLNPPDITVFQKAVCLARTSALGHSQNSYIYSDHEGYVSPVSHGAVYKREVFKKTGYVDESFDACEDVEFNYRVEKAGFKSYMSPSLSVKYYPRKDLMGLLRQMRRYGAGRFNFLTKHPEVFTWETLIPPVFVVGLLLLLPLAFLSYFVKKIVFSALFFSAFIAYGLYALLLVAESARIASKHRWEYFPYLIPIFFYIHLGLGWGFLVTWIGRKNRS